jgi:hypothetical protein
MWRNELGMEFSRAWLNFSRNVALDRYLLAVFNLAYPIPVA